MNNSFIADIQHNHLYLTFGYLVKSGEIALTLSSDDQSPILVEHSFEDTNFIILPLQIQKGHCHISVIADGQHLTKAIIY